MTRKSYLGKYLKADPLLKWWLVLFCASAIGLGAIGVGEAMSGGSDDGARLDAAGLDERAAGAAPDNKLNVSQLPDSSFIYDITIKELASADSYMDGQTVQVTGEVVGDRILPELDSSDCWVMLQSSGEGDDSEVAVYMPLTASESIDTYGAYGKRGTTLQVRGTFSMACTDHDGVTGIHADHASLVSRGAVSMPEFSIGRFLPGLILVIIGAALTIWYRYLSERRR